MTYSLRCGVLFAGFLCALPAWSAWWEFGRAEDEPIITELKLGKIDAVRLDDRLTLSIDDLDSGRIALLGRAEVRKGAIGLVEVSLDGGKTWAAATMGDRGFFNFEFRPDLERDYDFMVRALTTTGRATAVEDHHFTLRVRPFRSVDEVRQVFAHMLDFYSKEDRSSFLRLVSGEFEGIVTAVEEAIVSDFRLLDNINIQVNIVRIIEQDGRAEVSFTYNRTVQSARTGQTLRDSASSSATFKREGESYKLVRLASPLIFGVSFPEDVATNVTSDSIGQEVLQVSSSTGTAAIAPQQQTVNATSSVSGSVFLSSNFGPHETAPFFQTFAFESETKATEHSPQTQVGDIGYIAGIEIELNTAVRYLPLSGSFDSISTVPTSGYLSGAIHGPDLVQGKVFAIELLGPKYAVIELQTLTVSSEGVGMATIRYKYQPSGSQVF